MSKFNTPTRGTAAGTGYIASEVVASGVTHQGGVGFLRDEKSEIFLLGVSNFVGEDTFYESASDRDSRYAGLARKVAVGDLDWTIRFVYWLRNEANMRSAALVAALEGAKALIDAGIPGGRALVKAALHRADEPGEALAYWHSKFGRKVPQSVKRGIADAATASFNEYTLAKYDTATKGFRFGDVIELVHPSPSADWQSDLFKYALDRRRDSKVEVPASLKKLQARNALLALSGAEIRALADNGTLTERLSAAGLTWEALSGVIDGGMDAKAWESVIPSMGYMALMRNLRNFDEAGISGSARKYVADYLSDPERVAASRQLPFAFFSAYRAAPSDYWKPVLNTALGYALKNVPVLDGDTEYLIDTSGSMGGSFSARGSVTYAEAAALFTIAFAMANKEARVWGFDDNASEFTFRKGADVLAEVSRFQSLIRGGATYTATSVKTVLAQRKREGKGAPKRIVVVSDEQIGESAGHYWGYGPSQPALDTVVPADTMLYTFNIGGYRYGHSQSGMKNRQSFTGLNDSAFKAIPLIERGRKADFPF